MSLNPFLKREWGFCYLPGEGKYKGFQSQNNMPEDLEHCLKCGTQQGLQGVAITIGRKTYHLFYLCAKCGDVGIEELLKIIKWYKEKRTKSSE